MVWNIVHNVDIDLAKSASLDERYTFIDTGGLVTVRLFIDNDNIVF